MNQPLYGEVWQDELKQLIKEQGKSSFGNLERQKVLSQKIRQEQCKWQHFLRRRRIEGLKKEVKAHKNHASLMACLDKAKESMHTDLLATGEYLSSAIAHLKKIRRHEGNNGLADAGIAVARSIQKRIWSRVNADEQTKTLA